MLEEEEDPRSQTELLQAMFKSIINLKPDFAIGDSFWLDLNDGGRVQLECIDYDFQHEYGIPHFAITAIET